MDKSAESVEVGAEVEEKQCLIPLIKTTVVNFL